MIRVLHLTGTSAVGDGVFASLLTLYREIDRSRFTWDCLTFSQSESEWEKEWRALGGHVIRLPGLSAFSFRNLARAVFHIFSEKPGYQVAHCHVPALCGPFLAAAKQAGVPLRILHSHSTAWSGGGWYKCLRNAFCTRAGQHTANVYMACSKPAADFLFGKREKVRILPPAIDTAHFAFCPDVRRQVRAEWDLRGKFVVGHVGRFTPEKNHRFLLEVFALLHKFFPNSALLLVGDGVCRHDVERMCKRMGIQSAVHFIGARQDVSPFLQAMDAFVFPSEFEGLGAALLEAQAAGLPCVVSDRLPREGWLASTVYALSLRDPVQWWARQLLAIRGRMPVPTLTIKKYEASQAAGMLTQFYECGAGG